MSKVRNLFFTVGLAGALSGCGGGEPQPTVEEKDPNFGVNAVDKMKSMVGTPKAIKGAGNQSAVDKMKNMTK